MIDGGIKDGHLYLWQTVASRVGNATNIECYND